MDIDIVTMQRAIGIVCPLISAFSILWKGVLKLSSKNIYGFTEIYSNKIRIYRGILVFNMGIVFLAAFVCSFIEKFLIHNFVDYFISWGGILIMLGCMLGSTLKSATTRKPIIKFAFLLYVLSIDNDFNG